MKLETVPRCSPIVQSLLRAEALRGNLKLVWKPWAIVLRPISAPVQQDCKREAA